MTTSLAAQLKKLAVPETQSIFSGDYRQASFLYDDKEAATFDKQHFYNIGINGLQQLIEKDERFVEFEQTLFSPSSQSLQRYVQTSETNKQLDETITRFLLRLSPYMQLREAHKAMEWMIHRYSVHLRNVDVFMMCVLPYHDQEPFIIALRLVKLTSNECAKWRWLGPVQKGNTYLPRQTLITHCKSVRGFLGFICDMLGKHIAANTDATGTPSARHLQRVISFYTQTLLGVLWSSPPSESTISTLIPAISAGLKSHDLPDHMVSSYMILSQLFLKTSLTTSLLESLLNVIAKNVQSDLLRSAVMVLVIMFQKQDISKLPKKAFKYLSKHSSLTQILVDLSKEGKTEPFLTPYMTILTQRALKDTSGNVVTSDSNVDDEDDAAPPSLISVLLDSLTLIPLENSTITTVTREVLKWFVQQKGNNKMDVDDGVLSTDSGFRVFRLLENRFSSTLDSVAKELISQDRSGKTKAAIKDLLELSVTVSQQELTSDPVACLAVCLHHRHADVRKEAVERLLKDPSLMDNKQSVQSALALRLQDEDPSVLDAVLNTPQNLWQLFDDKPLLYQTLVKKLTVLGGKPGRNGTRDRVLQALCCMPEDVVPESEVTVIILSFLVPRKEDELSLADSLLRSPVGSWDKVLAHIKTEWLPIVTQYCKKNQTGDKSQVVLCSKLVDTLASYLKNHIQMAQSMLETMCKCLTVSPRPGSAALIILLANLALIKHTKKAEVRVQLQRQLLTTLSSWTLDQHLLRPGKDESKSETNADKDNSDEGRILKYLAQLAKKGTLPVDMTVHLLGQLDMAAVPNQLTGVKFWELSESASLENNWLWTVTIEMNLLLEMAAQGDKRMSSVGKELFQKFLQVLGDAKSIVKLLCMLWVAKEKQGVTSVHKARSLQFAQVFFKSMSDSDKVKLTTEPTPILPCLLILLSDQFEQVRLVAFSLLASLATQKDSEGNVFEWFAENLIHYREEVVKDCAFLAQVLKNILEGHDESLAAPPVKKRRRSSSKPPPHSLALTYIMDIIVNEGTSDVVRTGLLNILSLLDSSESFQPLIPLLKQLVSKQLQHTEPATPSAQVLSVLSEEEKEMVKLLLRHFTPTVAGIVEEKSAGLEALLAALTCPFTVSVNGEKVQMLVLHQLKSKFMAALPYSARQSVFTNLLNVMSTSRDVEIARQCRKVIKHMSVESSIVTEELKSVLAKSGAGTIREAKRQKGQSVGESEESELSSLPWKRIEMLLEMIQTKKKLSEPVLLVPVAFQVLGRVLELESKGSGEYIKQLLLGTVAHICSKHSKPVKGDSSKETVKGEHLNMELIVQCIRSSDNPHTHHQALLLLSSAAKIAPSLLLHNMMSVFTFMGASILRQDDAFSYQVIGRILDNVIPALIMACEEKSKDKHLPAKKKIMSKVKQVRSEDMMTLILRVFVDAIPYIPAHRKIMLFEKLVSVVGAETYLWRVILLYIESVTVRSSKPVAAEEGLGNVASEEEKSTGPLNVSDLEFLTSLTEEFSCSQLFQCFQQALSYVTELPEEKTGGQTKPTSQEMLNLENMTPEDMEIFSVPHHTAKQLRHFKFATVYALHHLTASQHLVGQLAEVEPSSFLPDYQSLMEMILQFIGQVTVSHNHHREDSSARFWRILLHKSHDFMDQLCNLLPDSMFMEVVSGLMEHSLPLVQRRAMELLNSKLQHYKESLSASQITMLLSMITKLESIVQTCLLTSSKNVHRDEIIINGQTALYSLKVLCKILGEKSHKPFMEVLRLCIKVLSHHHDNEMVSVSAMLCVAEVVSCAKVHTIEFLGEFMPLIISQLKSDAIMHHEVLLLAAVTSLQKIIEALPLFLSPYLLDIIVQICIISSLVGSHTESHKPAVGQKVKSICLALATVTPTRTFLPVLEKSFKVLEDRMAACVECAMSMLKDHIVKMSREDLTTFSQDLLKFFFVCFDIRVTNEEISEQDLDVVESRVIEAFVALVFKLSEAQFKPMLLQLYNWATDEDVSKERTLIFYRLCDSLAEKLKNLFTLFAGHIIKHSAQMLDENNKSKTKCTAFGKGKLARRKSCRLLCYIIDCLQKTFAHDTEGFMNKERFDVVMQSLVDQLENELGKDSVSEDRVVNHIVPCIASLAAAAQDDSLWKDLNYQILLKTRHESPKIRMWGLYAIDAFHKQLGEDYVQLVPETIPFLAELMEDESDEVEKQTQKVLAAMEVSVGENLQEYF